MNILFITRSYSKNKGGKEIYNYTLIHSLKKENEVYTITSGGGSILNLLWFYPLAIIKTKYYLLTKKINVVHFGDETEIEIGWKNLIENFEENNKIEIATCEGLTWNYKDNNRFKLGGFGWRTNR